MKHGVISDVHGNLEALRAVKAALRKEGVDGVLCLGDLVGYGASPNEVMAEAREMVGPCVAGNHDFGSVGKTDLSLFSDTAREACEWTNKVLTQDHREYLAELPLTHVAHLVTLVHASPFRPSLWNYVMTHGDVEEALGALTTPVCLIGHSHVPFLVEQDEEGELIVHESRSCELRQGARYIINVGSVGQPRDGSPDAAFAILDEAGGRVEIRRVAYDVKSAQKKILQAGLPRGLADRLAVGW